MKLKLALVIFTAALLACGVRALAQDTSDAAQNLENLRAQLSEVQDRETDLKNRLQQLNFELQPENIERATSGYGSVHPEELREQRRRQLQSEKDRVVTQLEQLASSRVRLEAAITNAQAKAYQQSALGATVLQTDQNRGAHLLTAARVLVGIAVLFVVIGSLVLRLLIRRRRNV